LKTQRSNTSPRKRIGACGLTLGLALSSPATAQLATSPDAVQVPAVTVSPTATSAAPAKPASPSAPKAAQQVSSPRSTRSAPQPAAETPTPATQAAASPSIEVPDASQVSVAPTGLTQPIDQIASSVTVIAGQEIEARQARNAPDILRAVPGIDVVQSGGPGDSAAVFIRGTNSNHVKVLIDGIDVSNPWRVGRTYEFGNLTTLDIDRVEVLRGPQSGLYGADALGGVIAFYTKEGNGPLQVEGLAEGGSFGTFNQAAGARGSNNGLRYSFNVAHQHVDNAPARTPLRIAPAGVPPLTGEYDNWTFSTKLGVDVTPNLAFNVAVRYTEADYDYQLSQKDTALSRQRSEEFHTRGETIWSLYGGRIKTVLGITYSDTSYSLDAPFFDTRGMGTRVKADWRTVANVANGITLVVGADWQDERLKQPLLGTLPFADQFAVEASERSQGAYVQAQLEPLRNVFIVGNVRHDDNENFGQATTWRFAPAIVFPEVGTRLKGSYGTAFKAPSLADRFLDYAPPGFPEFSFFGNRNLRPEKSEGFDLGFDQSIFNGRAQFGATYFQSEIEGLIVLSADQTTVLNLNSADISGIEAFFSADLSDNLRLRADYTYTEPVNAVTGQDLIRRPRNKAAFSLGWKPTNPLLLTTTLVYVGERLDGNRLAFGEIVRQPDYTVVNLAADYKINDHLSLIGRIDNLFDRRYEETNGFERPGFGAFAGLKFRN
jgi:vitamin B12 transporter